MFAQFATIAWSVAALRRDWRWERVLPLVADRALMALVVLAPLVWGGRGDIARLVYASLALMAAGAWLADQRIGGKRDWQWTPILWMPALAIAWVTLQLLPLPSVVVEWLSPRTAELLPLWTSDSVVGGHSLGEWRTLSLEPSAGYISLAVLMAHSLVALLLLQRLKSLKDIGQLLTWVGVSAVLMSVFGILQYLTANGLFFWVYEHPFRRSDHFVCGSFINHAHFASFLAMGAVAIAYQLARIQPKPATTGRAPMQRTSTDYIAIGWAAGLALVVLGLLMSASRGGLMAALAGALVVLIVYWRKRLLGGSQVAYATIVAGLLVGGIAMYSESRFSERLAELTTGSVEAVDKFGARRAIWSANVQAIAEGWLTGSGAGTHASIYPVYMQQSFSKVFTHAENGYLQIATEMGLPGVLLLVATLACGTHWTRLAWRRCTSREAAACFGAVAAGLVVSLVHSVVDFVWYLPATCLLALVYLLVMRRLALGDESRSCNGREKVPVEALVVVACFGFFMMATLAGPAAASPAWRNYLAMSAAQGLDQTDTLAEVARSGETTKLRYERGMLQAKAAELRSAVKSNPQSGKVHLRLARSYLQLFDARTELRENRMGLGQLQSTVAAGGFASAEDVRNWLDRAVGPDVALLLAARYHASQSVRLAPLEGSTYTCLANLAFLDNSPIDDVNALLVQAEQLRPHDGDVLFEIGTQCLVCNQNERGMDLLIRCFGQRGQHQMLVVASWAGRLPAAVFLESFQPDWRTLRTVWSRYRDKGDLAEQQMLLEYAKDQLESYSPKPGDPESAYVWAWLAGMHGDVGDIDQQLACLERAMAENGRLLAVRRAYAHALCRAERKVDAAPHLRWVLARDPTDNGSRKLLRDSATARYKSKRKESLSSRLGAGGYNRAR